MHEFPCVVCFHDHTPRENNVSRAFHLLFLFNPRASPQPRIVEDRGNNGPNAYADHFDFSDYIRTGWTCHWAIALAYSIGASSHESVAPTVKVATQPAKAQSQPTVAPTSAPVDPRPVNEPQAPNCATGDPGICWVVSFSEGMKDSS